jgi:hypothetical protein
MKIAKNFAFILGVITVIGINSCQKIETKYSDTKHENAVVVTLIYSPSQHNTEITRTAMHANNVVGTDYNGDMGIKIGNNMQITSTTVPERHGVVFQCEHGTFTIEGTDLKYKVLHDKLSTSIKDTVDILYREQYLVKYGKREGTDIEVELERTLVKLDFIDAQKKK